MKQDLKPLPPCDADLASPAITTWSPDRLLDAGATYWNAARNKIVVLWLIPIAVMAFGVGTALVGKSAYKWFVEEDRAAETVQVVCYAVSLVLSLLVLRTEWRRGDRLMVALYGVLAAGLVFMVGEELSWGQRLVGWVTPADFAAINKQKETNLHNIAGVGDTFKVVQMLVGAYGAILPWFVLRSRRLARYREQLYKVVPHFTLALYFAPLFLWRVYRNIPALEPPAKFYLVVSEYNEVMELIFALGILLFLVLRLRRYQIQTDAGAAAHG